MSDLETTMRQREAYHSIKVPEGVFTIIRVDGRAFHSLSAKEGYDRPYDVGMGNRMVAATSDLLTEFNGLVGYTQSDEISILLPPTFDLYGRSVEKLVSLSASIATRGYGHTEHPAYFDSRVVVIGNQNDAARYFLWRVMDAYRNFLSATVYWTLRNRGVSKRKATDISGGSAKDKLQILKNWGMEPHTFPEWMKQGRYVAWESYDKEGYNPITEETVVAKRRRLVKKEDIPHQHEQIYQHFLDMIASSM